MWSPDTEHRAGRSSMVAASAKDDAGRAAFGGSGRTGLLARLAVVGLLSGALAGCFQPLYAESNTTAGPSLMESMREVEIVQIQGRIGNELRNDLIFALTGGEGNPKHVPYQMIISVQSSVASAIVNSGSGLPENQIVRVTGNWKLVRSGDEKKKPVIEGSASGSGTIDVSDQRYANYAAARDAENRAARIVADQIKAQIAAYFIRKKNDPTFEQSKAQGS
ncbi:LPS assembly lipoprotein LptE [Xanthobacter pseudotagetidis]|uniref:LPS assembly lipoprotein LptE n=1 Tax=Xanthobacter pseudotagetidis TaxID=3119911 RepID=UPI003727CE35